MNISIAISTRRAALLAFGGALLLGFVSVAAHAAEKAATLPLTSSFEKSPPGEHGGPYALKLTNTGQAALKVSAVVDMSVKSHDRPGTRNVAAMVIESGKAGTIDDLAAHDKVTLTAEGYAPLVVVVPEKGGAKG